MKNLFRLLLLCLAASAHGATDIVPNPGDPGNLGATNNPFPVVYATTFNGALVGNASSATTATTATTANNLSAGLTNWHFSNVSHYGGDVTNVTTTTTGAAQSSDYTFYSFANNTNFLVRGGRLSTTLSGPGSAFYAGTNEQSGINGAAIAPASLLSVTFGLDSTEFVLRSSGNGQFTDIIVDGVDVLRFFQPALSVTNDTLIQFHSLKHRVIEIMNPIYFSGVYVPKTNSLWKLAAQNKKLLILGDSYVEQTSGFSSDILRSVCSAIRQGLPDNWDVLGYGQSGTGWRNPGAGGFTNFLGRMPDIVREAPDALVIFGGYNDVGYTTNNSETNIVYNYATNLLLQTRATFPSMPIFVFGPNVGNEPVGTVGEFIAEEQILSNACRITTNVAFNSPRGQLWITGYRPTANSGNANRYSASDDIHFNTYGYSFFGARVLSVIKPVILSEATLENIPASAISSLGNNPTTDKLVFWDASSLSGYGSLQYGSLGSGLSISGTTIAVSVDASGFNGNLTTGDDTLQEVAQKLDDLTAGVGDVTQAGQNNFSGSNYFANQIKINAKDLGGSLPGVALVITNSSTPADYIRGYSDAGGAPEWYIADGGNASFAAVVGDGSGLTSVNAATVTTVDSTDATSSILIADSATGNQAVKTDAGLTYNASAAILTTTANGVTTQIASNRIDTGTINLSGGSPGGIALYDSNGTTELTRLTNGGAWFVNPIKTLSTFELGNLTDTTLSRSAAGTLAVEGVDVLTTSSTATMTGKTYDSAGTGNTLKFKQYLYFRGFDVAVGALPINSNDWTTITYMKPRFLNGTDKASNYIEWRTTVPPDIDTSVDLKARIKFRLTGADTAAHRYVLSFASVADSASAAGSPSTEVNLDFPGDGSGASGDIETQPAVASAMATLTSWAAGLTANQLWVVRLARDGDTSDASTVDSDFVELVIEYGTTQ